MSGKAVPTAEVLMTSTRVILRPVEVPRNPTKVILLIEKFLRGKAILPIGKVLIYMDLLLIREIHFTVVVLLIWEVHAHFTDFTTN